jgi:hypothetical protein
MVKTIVKRHLRKTKRKTTVVRAHQRNYEFKGYIIGSDGKRHKRYGYTKEYVNSKEHNKRLGLD